MSKEITQTEKEHILIQRFVSNGHLPISLRIEVSFFLRFNMILAQVIIFSQIILKDFKQRFLIFSYSLNLNFIKEYGILLINKKGAYDKSDKSPEI